MTQSPIASVGQARNEASHMVNCVTSVDYVVHVERDLRVRQCPR